MNLKLDEKIEISTPNQPLEPTTEQVLREIEMYFSQRHCYDGIEQFSYREISYVLNKKIKQIEENLRSKNNDRLSTSTTEVLASYQSNKHFE